MRVPLTSGAYKARSLIANAQACLNLVPERNPEDSPVPFTYYTVPGLTQVAKDGSDVVRGLYASRDGTRVFEVIGGAVFLLTGLGAGTQIGTITEGHTPVSMADNGLIMVLVDGTANGYAYDLTAGTWGQITDPSFYGATRVDYVDTYFTFNNPGTQQWYISLSNADFGMMVGQPLQSGQAQGAGEITAPGSGYTDGTYTAVALSYAVAPTRSNPGSGATATVIVSGGAVTSVVPVANGEDYQVGDQLTVAPSIIGAGGSGFVWTTFGGAFDPLDVASKTGAADPIATQLVQHREVWLIGRRSTEVWYNSGDPDFTFAIMPGVFIQHGCVAPYSAAKQDLNIFWLSQDDEGQGIVVMSENYQAKRISTHAIEAEFAGYATLADAIGLTYQQGGHTFYQLTFPTADKTWVYDLATQLWHERAWTDATGVQHRVRANCACSAFGANLVGDWQSGALYRLDPTSETDAGQPIVWRRGFPHLLNDGRRASYGRFIADVDAGVGDKAIGLRWSDDKGHTFKAPVFRSWGIASYGKSLLWPRLGIGRDRVFELFGQGKVALNGAFLEVTPLGT